MILRIFLAMRFFNIVTGVVHDFLARLYRGPPRYLFSNCYNDRDIVDDYIKYLRDECVEILWDNLKRGTFTVPAAVLRA